MAKTLKELTAREVLALAIQAEEEDGRIYADLAERIGKDYPATAKSLQAMHDEEDGHRHGAGNPNVAPPFVVVIEAHIGDHRPAGANLYGR